MSKSIYMTVQQPGTKKVAVCSRRIGTRDRLNVIALANNEETAEKIVDALNSLQGKLDELDAPLKRELELARQQLNKARDEYCRLRSEVNGARHEKRELELKLHQVSRDLASMTDRALKAENPLVKVDPELRKAM